MSRSLKPNPLSAPAGPKQLGQIDKALGPQDFLATPPVKWVNPRTVRTGEPFVGLFPVDPDVLGRVTADMTTKGFDLSEPVVLGVGPWTSTPQVIDGHTKLAAALTVDIKLVPVVEQHFATLRDAVLYAIHRSRDRHDRHGAAIQHAVETLDQLRPRGGDRRSAQAKAQRGSKPSSEGFDRHAGESATGIAEALGTSRTTIERSRRVAKHPDLSADVRAGRRSIHAADREAAQREKAKAQQIVESRTPPSITALAESEKPSEQTQATDKANDEIKNPVDTISQLYGETTRAIEHATDRMVRARHLAVQWQLGTDLPVVERARLDDALGRLWDVVSVPWFEPMPMEQDERATKAVVLGFRRLGDRLLGRDRPRRRRKREDTTGAASTEKKEE